MNEPGKLRKKSRDGKPIRQLEGEIWMLNNRDDRRSGRLWVGAHDNGLRSIIESQESQGGYSLTVSDRNLTAAVDNVARQNTFHPIRDYLSTVVWDGVPRIETLFIDFLGCTDTPYHRQTAKLMMVAAATRAFEPGHKFDFVPILEGPQGIRKSTFIRVLAKDWFGELHIDSNNENRMIESMLGRWILEIPEFCCFATLRQPKPALSNHVHSKRVCGMCLRGEAKSSSAEGQVMSVKVVEIPV